MNVFPERLAREKLKELPLFPTIQLSNPKQRSDAGAKPIRYKLQ